MINIKDITWLAGILEGEGSFTFLHTPRINIGMTDLDTIERVRKIWRTNNKISRDLLRGSNKERYTIRICGELAISWMMTIYLFMSIRRKAKIREVIFRWKNMVGHRADGDARAKNTLIRNMMKVRKINYEEALNFVNSSLIQLKETIQ